MLISGSGLRLDLNQHGPTLAGRMLDLVETTVLELCCSTCSTPMTLVCLRNSGEQSEQTSARHICPSCDHPVTDQLAGTVIGVLRGHGLFPSPIRLRSAQRT